MKPGCIVALLTLAAGAAQAQAPPAAPAPAQAAAPCSPTAFAKGLCDSLQPSSAAPTPVKVLSLAPSDDPAASGKALHIDPVGQEGFEHAAAEWRQQQASPTPGGVPSIRPIGSRPAVVVPLLSF